MGSALTNANPSTRTSWGDFVTSYGAWMVPAPGGQQPFLPGHNCSYKRAVLLALGDELATLLESETVLHYRLAAAGHRLYLEPRARIAHTNFSPAGVLTSLPVSRGPGLCGHAAQRLEPLQEGRLRTRLSSDPVRPLHTLHRSDEAPPLGAIPLSVVPVLALTLLADGVGQVAAHISGTGNSEAQLATLEFRRIDHVTSGDRRALEALNASLRDTGA